MPSFSIESRHRQRRGVLTRAMVVCRILDHYLGAWTNRHIERRESSDGTGRRLSHHPRNYGIQSTRRSS